MLWSDGIGIVAGLSLMIPGTKDNIYRFFEADAQRKRELSPWPGLRTFVVDAWRQRRDSYSPWDSVCMLAGGLGLVVSFVLKIFEM
jgi:hypothetical protein